MSFRSHFLTRSQVQQRANRRARGQIARHGQRQPAGTQPPPAPSGEAIFRPLAIEGYSGTGPTGRVLVCRLCNGTVMATRARLHIAACWKVHLAPDEDIPMLPTRLAVLQWIATRKAAEAQP